ncbi:DedA family protein [Sciscionella marina]|uniref:DedA family protein n=1 Tax=Sciscionella marina TaxID=508770 RepID=UPI00035E482E|nr:VTT domain-containing protein [Sciscionella marina]
MIDAQTTATQAIGILDPVWWLHTFGTYVVIGVCLVIFIESSIFPVLPGDSLLFTVGLFVASGHIQTPLWVVCLAVTVAALIGNALGYFIGYKSGPRLFNRPDSKIFKREHVDKTHAFLEKHGPKAVVLARFVPFVRTFITWIAGIGRMDPKTYFTYTAIGGVLWAAGITVLGYFLGQIDFIGRNIDLIFVLIVLVSVLPIVIEYLLSRRRKKREAAVSSTGGAHRLEDRA